MVLDAFSASVRLRRLLGLIAAVGGGASLASPGHAANQFAFDSVATGALFSFQPATNTLTAPGSTRRGIGPASTSGQPEGGGWGPGGGAFMASGTVARPVPPARRRRPGRPAGAAASANRGR